MAGKIMGPVLAEWEDTRLQAEIILKTAFSTYNLIVGDDAIVYTVEGGPWGKMEEIGMLIFVSDDNWVYRPKSEYPKE